MKNSLWVITGLATALALGGCSNQRTSATAPANSPTTTASTASTSSTDQTTTSQMPRRTPTETTSSTQNRTAAQSSTAAETSSADRAASENLALTGCLAKGEADTYVLTEDKSGTKTSVSGTGELAKHANHRVTLTGTRGTGGTFTVMKIQHISATCDQAKP